MKLRLATLLVLAAALLIGMSGAIAQQGGTNGNANGSTAGQDHSSRGLIRPWYPGKGNGPDTYVITTTTGSTTGSTASTTGSTTSTTGSTTSGSTTGGFQVQMPMVVVKLQKFEEIRSALSYANSSNTLTSANKHVCRMVLETGDVAIVSGNITVNNVSYPVTYDKTTYFVDVVSPGELGSINVTQANVFVEPAPLSQTSSVPAVGAYFPPNTQFAVQIASTGALPGSQIQTVVHCQASYYYTDSASVKHYGLTDNYVVATWDISKLLCGDSSIDSRKAFGQPNIDGELPGDPNADASGVQFGGWVYKGGLFAGRMPYGSTADQSGLSRIQFWLPSGGSGSIVTATLALFDKGKPSSVPSDTTLGVFTPTSTDPNLSTTESSVKWETKWNIAPRAEPSDPPDNSQDPICTVTLGSSAGEYVNWRLSEFRSEMVWIPSDMAMSKICIALADESTGPCWRYFASREKEVSETSFPGTDSRPRVWRLGFVSQSGWQTSVWL